MIKPENSSTEYIASMCLELRALAYQNDLRFLARLLELANFEASIAQFDLETHFSDDCRQPAMDPPVT